MNNLVDSTYHLRKLWRGVKKTILKYNVGYLVLPIIYLIVIMIVVPTSKEIVNMVKVTKMDSYTVTRITKEDKKDIILDRFSLTDEQFKVIVGVTLAEAEYNSYEDSYAVINTIYNRIHSKSWVKSIENKFGKDKGKSLYYQVISPNQFTVYQSGSYKKYMDDTESVGYNAIIDFLFTEKIMHNYLSFRSNHIKVAGSESYSLKGNNYFNVLLDENRV